MGDTTPLIFDSIQSDQGQRAKRKPRHENMTPRRSSLYLGRVSPTAAYKPTWSDLMREAESLDTDALFNTVSFEAEKQNRQSKNGASGKRPCISPSKLRGVIKWMVSALIGELKHSLAGPALFSWRSEPTLSLSAALCHGRCWLQGLRSG